MSTVYYVHTLYVYLQYYIVSKFPLVFKKRRGFKTSSGESDEHFYGTVIPDHLRSKSVHFKNIPPKFFYTTAQLASSNSRHKFSIVHLRWPVLHSSSHS